MNLVETTDNIGQVVFSLPNLPYKVRADYMTRQYWSEEFTGQNTTINIPMADAEVNVSWNGYGLENVPVYVYSESASYLGILGWTDSDGNAVFRLPAATHEFRADYLGGQYWSGEAVLQSGIVNPVIIYTGGGTFNLTVLKDQQAQTPLIGEKTYLFNDSDLYLEISNTTNEFGQLSFDLPEGLFKFRIDTLGYQFWTGLYDVPQILSDEFTIPHQDVTITVQGLDPDPTALAGVNVYLFTPADFYLGLNLLTDSNGQAVFNLPDRQYKVRADFLDHQFWSDVFQWQDTTVSINRGIAELHVNRDGVNIVGAMVYLFSESGSYLGQLQMTDENGAVQFLLPDRPYKFRIDEGGNQYWSDSVQVAPDQTNIVDIDLAPPTVNITADPATILTGNLTALTWSTTNAHSCTIEPGIGDVSVNGSVDVSPAATTTYTITAAGPGGTAVASVKVFVGVSTQADFISLVIDHNKIDENLTNFPVLLKLSDNSGVGGFDASNMLNELMPSVDANDEFHGGNGEFPNSNLWSSNGYPDYVSIQSDKLNIRIDSIDAWNEVHSKDTYRLRGDFDIQVDCEVVAGPGITRWHAFLGVRTDSGHYSRIERYYSDTQGGHGYRHLSFDGSSWCTEGLVNRSDPSGRLRLIRAGSIFESYAWFDDRWNLIATGDDFETTEDVYVQIVLSGDGDKPYAEVNFDNFQINYASVGSVEHRKKFAVYDANGRQCYAEIENWDPFEKAARLWVNVPDVSATEGTTLKIYFDLDMQAQDTKPPEKSNDEFEIENQGIPTPELWWTGGQPTVQAGKLRLHSTGPLQRIRSKWYAQGDFDIRHDFELIQNPAVNRWNFVLRLVTSDGKIVQIYYRYWDGYEYIFNSYDGSSWSTSGSVNRNDVAGKLRITRTGDVFYGYYWDTNNGWVELGNTSSTGVRNTGDVRVEIFLDSIDNDPAVEVHVDNFSVNSDAMTGFVGDTGEAPAWAVWDDSYKAVYHFEQTSGALIDSTSRKNDGTTVNLSSSERMKSSPGGNAYLFEGSEYIDLPDTSSFKTSHISIEALVKVNSDNENWARIFDRYYNSQNGYYLCVDDNDKLRFGARLTGAVYTGASSASTVEGDGNWHYVVGGYHSGHTKLYNDGVLHTDSTTNDDVITHLSSQVPRIGDGVYYQNFKGYISEIRVSSVEHSAAWIKATYHAIFENLLQYTDDTDGDGLKDSDEVFIYGTDPNKADSDEDGINDADELAYYGEHWDTDADGDGIINLLDPDSDNDGIFDGAEILTYGTNPLHADSDDDTLSDYDEINVHGTDPNKKDGDSDFISDWWELAIFGNLDQDKDGDFDNDGISNYQEYRTGDYDGDGVSNYIEDKSGFDPTNGSERPAAGLFYDYDSMGRIKAIFRIN